MIIININNRLVARLNLFDQPIGRINSALQLPVTTSGDPDAHHVHDLKLHTTDCFTAGIIGHVNALTLDIPIGLLAFESEGCRATLGHERVNNPVTLGSLHMRCHLEHVGVDKLAVPLQ